jgi:hypothetical protein
LEHTTSPGLPKRRVSLRSGLEKVARSFRITDDIIDVLCLVYPEDIVWSHVNDIGKGVSLETWRVLMAEQTLKFFKTTDSVAPCSSERSLNRREGLGYPKDGEASLSARKAYFKRYEFLDAIRTVFDCVSLAYQEIRKKKGYIPSIGLRNLNFIKVHLVEKPFSFALQIKELATLCRAHYFGGSLPRHGLVKWMTGREALIFSYVARSLPSLPGYLADKGSYFKDLEYRLTRPPPIEPPDWRSFIRGYLARNRGKGPISIWAEPSVNAGLGYPSLRWGHSAAYRDLILFKIGSVIRDHGTRALYEYLYAKQQQSSESLPRYHLVDTMLHTDIRDTRVVNAVLLDACELALDLCQVLPARAIFAPEKGMKVRIPTLGLTAANLVQQAFRKAADHFLLQDPRSSQSLGGKKRVRLRGEPGSWYSQDLSFATDCHGFWAQRVLYEELLDYVPELRRFEKFIPLLFGPRLLIPGEAETIIAPKVLGRRVVAFPSVIQKGGKPLPMYGKALPGIDLKYEEVHDISIEKVIYLDLDIDQLIGQVEIHHSEGVTTHNYSVESAITQFEELQFFQSSFFKLAWLAPNLDDFVCNRYTEALDVPCLSEEDLVSYANSYRDWYKRCSDPSTEFPGRGVNIARQGVITTRGAMMGEPTSWAVLPLVTFYSVYKVGLWRCISTGDDALIPRMTPAKREAYDAASRSLGGIISRPKSFLHKTRGLFCEQPYEEGHERQYQLLSYWVAPAGGTKGEINWYNLPSAFRGHRLNFEQPTRASLRQAGLFKFSKFQPSWRAACELGIPLGADEVMGGLRHPSYPVMPVKKQSQWFSYLSSISLESLLLFGGLSLIPPLEKTEGDRLKAIFNLRMKKELSVLEPPSGIPIKDALSLIKNPSGVRAIFDRTWSGNLLHVPSLRNVCQKFTRRIDRAKPSQYIGSPWALLNDLREKQVRFLPHREHYLALGERAFGLTTRAVLPMEKSFHRQAWPAQNPRL